MAKILWKAKNHQIKNSNFYNYENFLKKNYNFNAKKKYKNLLKWSIKYPIKFWSSIWDFAEVKGKKNTKSKLLKKLYKNKFFFNSKINFAENLLRTKENSKAVTFISENKYREIKTWKELYDSTSKIVNFFKKKNIKFNDRVAAYLPNTIETVECFLATSTIGAIWSSCSPDFGTRGVIERFSQIKPKILIIVDSTIIMERNNVLSRLPEILKGIKSIKSYCHKLSWKKTFSKIKN